MSDAPTGDARCQPPRSAGASGVGPVGPGPVRRYTITRVGFGVIWGIDATLKWLPGFRHGLVGVVRGVAHGQPDWLAWWFSGWLRMITAGPAVFAVMIALAETAVALGLILGVAQRVTFGFGIALAVVIWSVGEGFGGPYGSGATDIGAAIMYAGLFGALWLAVPATLRAAAPALDHRITRRWPALSVVTFAARTRHQDHPQTAPAGTAVHGR